MAVAKVKVGFMHVLGADEGLCVCGTDGVDAENSLLVDVAGAVIAELATLEDAVILADGKALLRSAVADGEALAQHGVVVAVVAVSKPTILMALVGAVL